MAALNGDTASACSNFFLVVKIGGSLFSDKEMEGVVDEMAVITYTQAIRSIYDRAAGQLAIVIGGGSFGHPAVRKMDRKNFLSPLKLTEANFRLKWLWAEALHRVGVPAIPFQAAAFACVIPKNSRGRTIVAQCSALRKALNHKFVPILTGDSLVGEDGHLHIVGSDSISELFFDVTQRKIRLVALTNTPGVLFERDGLFCTVPEITLSERHRISHLFWSTGDSDVTGAMEGKVMSLLNLAALGAECIIAEGRTVARKPEILFRTVSDWPANANTTRIHSGE